MEGSGHGIFRAIYMATWRKSNKNFSERKKKHGCGLRIKQLPPKFETRALTPESQYSVVFKLIRIK
jgi:hypothetical protein